LLNEDNASELPGCGTELALLRRLEIQTMRGDEREQLLNSVPAHCTETVMELARECSRFWKEFSLQLEERRQVSA